jgi:hypothetical protein
MNRLSPSEAAGFARRYGFRGGRIRRVQLRYHPEGSTQVVFDLRVTSGRGQRGEKSSLRLRLVLTQVAEFRFQMRPHRPRRIIEEARFGYWNGLFYLMFDAAALDPGEMARVHDYRASEVYAAGQQLYWEERPGPTAPSSDPPADSPAQ